jgi:hypothetical protein
MTAVDAKVVKGGEERRPRRGVVLDAVGLEAEFSVLLDGAPARPEDVFGSPTKIVRGHMMHRTGRSYHLPTGGAVYFDTGVIEIATPVIELDKGCAARAGRSLWESICFLRGELDAWEEAHGHSINLVGFSTHYNVSFNLPPHEQTSHRTVHKLAKLLTYIVPIPVMLLAANRRSTGIGARPRVNRIEITADFTPDAALMIACATLIIGIVRGVMEWPSYELKTLDARGFPVLRRFAPEPHTSRKGWVARVSSFSENPFLSSVNDALWLTRGGEALSLREIARRVTRYFWPAIERIGDDRSLALISAVMNGRVPSLLELDDRPPAYESVGRLCAWDNLFTVHALPRSGYERVFIDAIAQRPRQIDGDWYTPTGMHGWSHVVFRRDRDHTRHVFPIDYLVRQVDRTGKPRPSRTTTRERQHRTIKKNASRRRAKRSPI